MGFFSKIKDNFNGGGVDVKLLAPLSAGLNDISLPAQVTVISQDKPQTINSVHLELRREWQTRDNNNNTSTNHDVLAETTYSQLFVLQAGQQQVIDLQLTLNQGAAAEQQLTDGDPAKGIASAFGKLQQFANAMDQKDYEYSLIATADVEGITFDPSDRFRIQILEAGQFGGGFNARL